MKSSVWAAIALLRFWDRGLSIHETGHLEKPQCETSSHVKVERMDTFVCSGRGELEGKN